MSAVRQLLRQKKAEIQAAMTRAMNEAAERAAAPYREDLRDIDVALFALEAPGANAAPVEAEQPVTVPLIQPDESLSPSPRAATKAAGMTLKEMVLDVLSRSQRGMDALAILAEINGRWNVGLVRTSLSPQLSRLKHEGKVQLVGKDWSLAQKDETPGDGTPGARMVGVAGSPEGPTKLTPTGSTPVASTTSQLFPDDARKEVDV